MTQNTIQAVPKLPQKKEQDGKLENMKWPTQSPDQNSNELVWDELNRSVKPMQPTNATHLWELLREPWEELSEEYLIYIVERMPAGTSKSKVHQNTFWARN